ncbi:MAG: hypothetical protein PHU71_05665 [Candidatus Gracilibacteria bacterium]|nr:hypothetical protein [Candidatus Gracilibacteria bacterium]
MGKTVFALIFLTLFAGCSLNTQTTSDTNDNQDTRFAVYLADTNSMLFSDEDLSSYEPSTQTFTFNSEGAKKMKSYQSSLQIDSGLYEKPFVVKLGNEEIYRGKFWSSFSSLSESGIVMTDVAMIGPDYNILTVDGGYPSAFGTDNDKKINDPRIIEHFKNINKIK